MLSLFQKVIPFLSSPYQPNKRIPDRNLKDSIAELQTAQRNLSEKLPNLTTEIESLQTPRKMRSWLRPGSHDWVSHVLISPLKKGCAATVRRNIL